VFETAGEGRQQLPCAAGGGASRLLNRLQFDHGFVTNLPEYWTCSTSGTCNSRFAKKSESPRAVPTAQSRPVERLVRMIDEIPW
jgi:hypothetical protein